MRAGLTQVELSQRAGRDRSVIARWEQGLVSPPVESLLACVEACGFELPLELVQRDDALDEKVRDELLVPPSERVQRLLGRLENRHG